MALDKPTLQSTLQTGLTTILNNPQITNNAAIIAAQVATLFANAIDVYVKTGNAVGADTGGDGHNLTIV